MALLLLCLQIPALLAAQAGAPAQEAREAQLAAGRLPRDLGDELLAAFDHVPDRALDALFPPVLVAVTVHTADGDGRSVSLPPGADGAALKRQISEQYGVAAADQQLLCASADGEGYIVVGDGTLIGELPPAADGSPAPLTLVIDETGPYLTRESPEAFAARRAGLATEEERAAAHPERIASGAYTNTTDGPELLYAAPGHDRHGAAFALTIANGTFKPRPDLADQDLPPDWIELTDTSGDVDVYYNPNTGETQPTRPGDGETHARYWGDGMTLVFSGGRFALAGIEDELSTSVDTYAGFRFDCTDAAYMAEIYLNGGGSVRIDRRPVNVS